MKGQLDHTKLDGILTIKITGMFDARLIQNFRAAYQNMDEIDTEVILDLGDTEYLDSAALGLLIHMKKKLAHTPANHIRIINSNERITKLFHIMQFDQMFDLDN